MNLNDILEQLKPKEQDYILNLIERDHLTGAYNKKKLEKDIKTALSEAKRDGRHFSLIMIDIDDFKHYNDSHGHVEGDRLLKDVAHCLDSRMREHEQNVYRYGGEEFVILIPNAGEETGLIVAERLRESVKKRCGVTISIGVVNYINLENASDPIKCADQAMYEAKKSGKDRAVIYKKQ